MIAAYSPFILFALGFYSLTDNYYGINNTANILLAEVNTHDSIRFDFSASYVKHSNEDFVIYATLKNQKKDTVYFLTSTCDGDQYSLVYDASQFKLTPAISCNASFPKLIKIPPNGKYQFKAQFRSISSPGTMKLGFDFYQVDKSFDFTKLKLADIHNRSTNSQNILWANMVIE